VADLSLSKLPWYGQLGVFVVGALALAGAFYYFHEIGVQAAMAEKQATLTETKDTIAKGVAQARRLPEFRKQVTELEARLEGLKPILPEEKDVGELLRRVNTLAVQSNLVILNFRPLAIAQHDMHAEWPITLQLEGNYHNLGLFLDRVSKFPRIINIGGLVLSQKVPPVGGATMTISATATTFVMADRPIDPAVAAAEAAAAKKKADRDAKKKAKK
jgi:type IV pilus assembly protein PilO